jgi:hypothetical protein
MAHPRSLTLLKAFLAANLALAGPLAGPAAAAFPTTEHRIRNWEPEFMANDHSYTRAEALAHAQEFDVIIALQNAFRAYVADMKAVNPDLVLLVYTNGGYSVDDGGSKHPEAWYAKDRYGRKIKSSFGNYLMTPSNAGWRDNVGDRCVSARLWSGYDGCFLDSLGPAALEPGYNTGLPINPATGNVWARKAWLEAQSSLAEAVKTRIGGRIVVANGITNGVHWFHPDGSTDVLATGIGGAMVELFVRLAYQKVTVYRSEAEWKKDVDMLVNAEARGLTLLCVTKVWSAGTIEKKEQIHRFALGTFLLGTSGRSYFSFLSDRNTGRPSSLWDLDLGVPVEAYRKVGGVYQRTYSKGKVLVNPTDDTFTVSLGRTYITLSGVRVTSLTMNPHSAALLREV